MISKFRAGSAVYKCLCCGKMTRETGVQSMGSELCPYCYEEAGYENELQDGSITQDEFNMRILELKLQYKRD